MTPPRTGRMSLETGPATGGKMSTRPAPRATGAILRILLAIFPARIP
jgi:hypothetical protein